MRIPIVNGKYEYMTYVYIIYIILELVNSLYRSITSNKYDVCRVYNKKLWHNGDLQKRTDLTRR